jgi:hypothetical protein
MMCFFLISWIHRRLEGIEKGLGGLLLHTCLLASLLLLASFASLELMVKSVRRCELNVLKCLLVQLTFLCLIWEFVIVMFSNVLCRNRDEETK